MQNYTIYDEIGRGTMSFVYKARRKRSIEYVAVKSTDKTRMDKILNEVQILHRLDSRHVLKFFNWYESTNHIWLIFEYCIGGDLLKLITQDRRLPEPAVKAFGWQLVGGLQYLHANSILYCDLKPANILIDECGSLKLADFGLARRIPTAESILSTPLGPGSPNYMAPELFQPPAIHSFASDFWALGCVLYELVTGRQPFTHTFFPELARIIQTEPLVIPEDEVEISREFKDLLCKLLEKDPYRRITWLQLRGHPFWAGCAPLDDVELPDQELFEATRHERQHEIMGESLSIAIPNPQDAPYQQRPSEEKPVASPATESASDRSPSGRPSDNDDEENSDRDDGKDNINRSDIEDLGEDDPDEVESADDNAHQPRPITAPLPKTAASEQGGSQQGRGAQRKRNAPSEESKRAIKTAPVGGGKRHPLQSTADRRMSLTKVSRLLFLPADSTVKPIAYCDDIENITAPEVDPDHFDFEALSAEELLECATEDLEDHLKSIYISLKANDSSAQDKTNVLAHLFRLSLHPRLANVIVNSSLLTLMIKLLNHSSPTTASSSTSHANRDVVSVTSAITLVLGVLFRFATFISSTSPENIQALVIRLSDIVRTQTGDTSTRHSELELKAKRSAMACLGELLFYLATQGESKIPAAATTFLLKALDDSDVVTRHYAIRTVANILTQSTGAASALVHEHVVLALLRSLLKAKESPNEGMILLQTSAMQALAQVFRHIRLNSTPTAASAKTKVAVMMALWKTSVLSSLWDGVASGKTAPDLAVASLNVLNAYLEMNLDKTDDEAAQAIAMKHKRTLLKKIVKTSVLESLLEAKSKFEEDDQIRRANRVEETRPGRRYEDDGRTLPSLLRAKTLLFVYFAVQRSGDFARLFVREQLLDKVELLLAPFSATLRAGGLSPQSSSSRKQECDSALDTSPPLLPPTEQYLVQCGLNVVRLSIRTALKMGAECISSSDKIDYDEKADSAVSQSSSPVASEPFQLIEQLVKNPTCRVQLCQYFLVNGGKEFRFFVRLMSKLLTSFATEKLVAMHATVSAVISRLLLLLFRSSPSDAAALVAAESEDIFLHLLPAIVVQLQHVDLTQGNDDEHSEDEEDNDHSVNCIQLVYLVMIQLPLDLDETTMVVRDEFARKHLLPCFQALFGSTRLNENVWRVAVDLLHGLVLFDPQLVDDFESSGLVGPVLSLLSSPTDHQYHSLPASATALVRIVVEASKKANAIRTLYDHNIARHITEGLEFAVDSSAFTSGTVDLLDALYVLVYSRYEERRKATGSVAHPDFEDLVWTGPLLVHLCANADVSNGDVDPKKTHQDVPANSAHHEILESASRCLVYVSQLFGAQLNEVLFEKARSPSHKDQATRDLASCLRLTQHEAVLLRVLLTIKNSLRCVKKNDAPLARRWLQNDRSAMSEVVRISKWEHKSPSANPEQSRSRDQVIKAASEILTFFQTTTTTR